MNKWTAAAAAMAIVAGPALAGDHTPRGGNIEGVWQTTVQLRVCATGAALFDPFPAINTFHEGGTMSEHGARMSPATRNSGQGIWRQVGHNRFMSRFVFQRFDLNGFYIGDQVVSRRMTLSPDGRTLEITATVRITDAAGVLLTEGCATETAQRF